MDAVQFIRELVLFRSGCFCECKTERAQEFFQIGALLDRVLVTALIIRKLNNLVGEHVSDVLESFGRMRASWVQA
jgi:hypothetical protein